MRTQILIVQWIFLLLFTFMITYICVYAGTHEKELFNNDYNGRQEKMLAENVRGKIYSSDGKVLAETVTGSDGKDVRSYPFKNVFCHVVGYSEEGGSGIEKDENYDLVHSNLSLAEKATADKTGSRYAGNDVYTTLDTNLQQAASDALGAYRGAIIVSDPKTGKILAMVSKPDFDPNNIVADWDSYLNEKDGTGTLLNRVTQGKYPPGSTFKILDTIEYLKENPTTWQNYNFTCTGSFTKDNEMIHCFHWEQHSWEDYKMSFANSCNCSFANIGLSLNRSEFSTTLKSLMFDGDLPYPYDYSKSSFTLDDSTTTKEVMQLAIGQGQTSMSPLHMNLITQAVANGGMLMQPILVDSVKTGTGTVITQSAVKQYKQLFDSSIASSLTEFMRAVVTQGTASKLSTASYEAAGKTGSAEFDSSDSSQSHAWFTGFAPASDPKVCITVIIEGAGSGGDYAVPIARRVLDKYFGVTSSAADYETGSSINYSYNSVQQSTDSTSDETAGDGASADATTEQAAGDGSSAAASTALPDLSNVVTDPETGDLLDTTTGTLYDPQTGAVVGQKDTSTAAAPADNTQGTDGTQTEGAQTQTQGTQDQNTVQTQGADGTQTQGTEGTQNTDGTQTQNTGGVQATQTGDATAQQ
ncbi:MAG: penicillin-binding protein 2 [Lachnospiraceae bacterium]|nr:penicillin-binding protein 2 [Lachnospiraceae bacterium]